MDEGGQEKVDLFVLLITCTEEDVPRLLQVVIHGWSMWNLNAFLDLPGPFVQVVVQATADKAENLARRLAKVVGVETLVLMERGVERRCTF